MGSYASIAPKLEPRKLNKWKKQMLWYLAGMELYYLKCIKDGPFQPKTTDGHAKPESQWTPDERRVVVQDQRLKSIIMSCLSDDIIESVNSCISAKETWTDLVHSFEGPLDTKENKIMDLNLSIKLSEQSPLKVSHKPTLAIRPCSMSLPMMVLTFDEKEVFNEEEATHVKVLMALADDELTVGKSHARNGGWVDITIRKVNTLFSMDEDADWKNNLKYINIDLKFVEEQ
nr:retrovirus-related Pol polyprotein from transposon TNT 1-94 [Tanacetum cinerariifolium]